MNPENDAETGPSARDRIRSLEQSLERDPADVPSWILLARQFMRLAAELEGEVLSDQQGPALEDAVRATEEALVREPANLDAFRILGEAYLGLAGWQGGRGIDPEATWRSAMRAFETVIQRRPFDPEPYRRFAWASFWFGIDRQERNQEARGLLMKAAEAQVEAMLLEPTHMVDTHMLRLFHNTLLMLEAARSGKTPPDPEDFRSAPLVVWRREVRRAPADPDVRARLGIVQLSDSLHATRSVSPEQALRTFARALVLKRDHFGALFATGATWRYLGEERKHDDLDPTRCFRKAVAALRRAARVRPEHQRVWVELGRAALLLGQQHKIGFRDAGRALRIARASCERALLLDPDDMETRSRLGEVVFYDGVRRVLSDRDARRAFEDAARIHAETMRLEPENNQLLWFYATALEWLAKELLRRAEDARAALLKTVCVFETLIERDPKRTLEADRLAELRFELAKAQAKAGEDAAESYTKAIDLCRAKIQREPKRGYERERLADVAQSYGDWLSRRGADPRAAYEIAIRALEDAGGRTGRGEEASLDRIAALWTSLARWQAGEGMDARAAFSAAIDLQRRRLALPGIVRWWRIDLANAVGELARWKESRGEDPREEEREWVQVLEQLTSEESAWSGLGDAWLARTEFEAGRGADPHGALDRATLQYQGCLARSERDRDARAGLADARRLEGELFGTGSKGAREAFLSAIRECDEVLRQGRRIPGERRARGEASNSIVMRPTSRALRVKGEALFGLGRRAAARHCFERALALDPDDGRLKRLVERARQEGP
ncbi:MAG: hypothetical protein HY720_01555 [Planctomycetes bacterium]|nr:hypothetical protein [Planctomycetota bacterium]